MTKYFFNVTHYNPQNQKLFCEFGKEMKFDVNKIGRKCNREKSLIKLLNWPAIMASSISSKVSSENPNELCDRLKLLIQEKQAGNNSNLIDKEIVAIADISLEYKCISTKQHKILLIKCLN